MPSSRHGSQQQSRAKMQACVASPAQPKQRPTFSRDTGPSSIRSSAPNVGQEQAEIKPYLGDQWQRGFGTFDFNNKARSDPAEQSGAPKPSILQPSSRQDTEPRTEMRPHTERG